MVKRCINPECLNEFRHLNTGDLYALECGMADTKFLWLCADCGLKLAVAVDPAGAISLRQRTATSALTSWTVPASHAVRLRLVAGHRPPEPWYRARIWARSNAIADEPVPMVASAEAA